MKTIIRAAAIALGLAAATVLYAQSPAGQGTPQSPPQQPQQPPVFRTGANLVRVDVSVIDRHGEPVKDLRKEDFEVSEDNIPQTVQTIKLVEATGAAPDDDTSLPIRSPEHAAQEAARDDIRVVVIFWDEYHIGQFAPAIHAREALVEFAQTAFGPTDLVALMDQLTPTDTIRFSRDRTELVSEIRDLQGRQGVYIPARSAVEEAQMALSHDVEMIRSQVTASALESTIAFLGTLKEGRKAILFVSQTIGRVGSSPMDTDSWLQKAIALANTNNTTIYTLDPRGMDLNSRPSAVLQSLAENTGGRMFATNFPAVAMREIVKDESAYYLLGYSSSQNPADGKFHRIRVKVNRPGVEVKARTGYLAPSLADTESARDADKHAPPPEIAKSLETIGDAPHVPVTGDFWVGASSAPDGSARVTVTWTPRADAAKPTAGADAFGTVHATGADERTYFDGPLTHGRVTFAAPPGTLRIRHETSDPDGALGDRVERSIDVPDFAHAALAMSTPAVFLARTPFEFRTLRQNADPVPFAGRQFDRADRVLVRFTVLGTAAADAQVTATLLSRTGTALAALPMTSDRDQHYELDLPLTSIAQGEYVIAIEAAHGTDHVKALVPLKVVPE